MMGAMTDSTRRRGPALLAVATLLALTACTSPDSSPTPTPDSGFDIQTNSFSFPNYGNEEGYENLDAQAMRELFGDQVCARIDEGGRCVLSATAGTYMEGINDAMDDGHCFGMAGLSWALFDQEEDPQQFGGPDAADLTIDDNPDLQRELAKIWATQATPPTKTAATTLTGQALLDQLERAWGQGQGFIFGIFRMKGGEQTGGHAVTPYAIRDQDDGTKAIAIYDNNYPQQENLILVDPVTGEWSYRAQTKPGERAELYEGGPNNPIELTPVDLTLRQQQCPFCPGASDADDDSESDDPTFGSAPAVSMVSVNQRAHHRGVALSVTDKKGRPIPGQETFRPTNFINATVPAVEIVPADEPFLVVIDGSDLRRPANTDVTIVRPGYSFSAGNIDMQPGSVDDIWFYPVRNEVSYGTDLGASPDLFLTFEDPDASYEFRFGGLRLPRRGGDVDVALDQEAETVRFASPSSRRATLDFRVKRIGRTQTDVATSDPIPVRPNEAIVIPYGRWRDSGKPLRVGIDVDGDGTIDEPLIRRDSR